MSQTETVTQAPTRGDPSVFPQFLYEAYRSTLRRAPTRALIDLPLTLTEQTGPGPVISRVTPEDADLTRNAGTGGEAIGQRIIVTGRVLDDHGQPVPNTLLEIWQTNAAGRYIHLDDQWPGPLRRRDRRLVFNYAKSIVEKTTSYLMSGMHSVVDPEDESPEAADRARRAERALEDVAEQNGLAQLDFDTETDAAVLGEACQRNAEAASLLRGVLRGRDRQHRKPLLDPHGQPLDDKRRRRPRAEPEDHAALDKFNGSLGGGAWKSTAARGSECAGSTPSTSSNPAVAAVLPVMRKTRSSMSRRDMAPSW